MHLNFCFWKALYSMSWNLTIMIIEFYQPHRYKIMFVFNFQYPICVIIMPTHSIKICYFCETQDVSYFLATQCQKLTFKNTHFCYILNFSSYPICDYTHVYEWMKMMKKHVCWLILKKICEKMYRWTFFWHDKIYIYSTLFLPANIFKYVLYTQIMLYIWAKTLWFWHIPITH